MLVSVAIATRRGGRWLEEALESVWLQGVKDLEVVLVDDGVVGGLDKRVARHPRVRVVEGYQRGLALARNLATAASRGEYIAVLDDDDRWLPGKLEAQLELFSRSPGAAMCHTGFEVIDEEGRPLYTGWARPLEPEDALSSHAAWLHSATMWRRSYVVAVGGYSARFARVVDLDLVLKTLGRWPTLFEPRVLAQYRVHGGRTSGLGSYREGYRSLTSIHAWRDDRVRKQLKPGKGRKAVPQFRGRGPRESRRFAVEAAFAQASAAPGEVRQLASHIIWAVRTDPVWAFYQLARRGAASTSRRIRSRRGSRPLAAPGSTSRTTNEKLDASGSLSLDHRTGLGDEEGHPHFHVVLGATGTLPLVSVTVIVKTGGAPLTESIESVWAQGLEQVEVVILQHGAGSVPQGIREHNKVRLVQAVDEETALRRNLAIGAARGEYIAFLEEGDCWLQDKLSAQLELLKANPIAAMCYTHCRWADETAAGALRRGGRATQGPAITLRPRDTIISDVYINHLGLSTALWRTSALASLGGYDPDLGNCQDLDLMLSAQERWPVLVLPRPLSLCRAPSAVTDDRAYRVSFALADAVARDHAAMARDGIAKCSSDVPSAARAALRHHYAQAALAASKASLRSGRPIRAFQDLAWAANHSSMIGGRVVLT